jgi:hypothetical protein
MKYVIEKNQSCQARNLTRWYTEEKKEIFNFLENDLNCSGRSFTDDYENELKLNDDGEVINYDEVFNKAFEDFMKNNDGAVGDWQWSIVEENDIKED